MSIESGSDGPEGTEPVERWAYVSSEMKCTNFTFNGRRATQNNFLSEADCLGFCNGKKVVTVFLLACAVLLSSFLPDLKFGYLAINPCRLPVPLPLEQCVPGPGACGNRPDMFCHIGASPQTTVCCPAEGRAGWLIIYIMSRQSLSASAGSGDWRCSFRQMVLQC